MKVSGGSATTGSGGDVAISSGQIVGEGVGRRTGDVVLSSAAASGDGQLSGDVAVGTGDASTAGSIMIKPGDSVGDAATVSVVGGSGSSGRLGGTARMSGGRGTQLGGNVQVVSGESSS